ncbi:MAG: 2-C-methyl-D-erythritol 4-phosphate cytidylyltransferase [Cyanobacteria bacterium]|nr:2-C-methyl-D-erythritol 4-phosphate cytidylyltransferase [Cyanobacteriota bacterium]
MIENRSVLAIVSIDAAESGRGRVYQDKLNGKPILGWTVESVKQAKLVDRAIVSTDDPQAAAAATQLGLEAPFRGPSVSSAQSVAERAAQKALHAISHLLTYNYVIVINAQAPLIKACDLDGCIMVSVSQEGLPAATVTETQLSLEHFCILDGDRNMIRIFDGIKHTFPPSPPRLYAVTNSVFVASRAYLIEHKSFITQDSKAYILPKERSWKVETKADILIAEGILRRDRSK